MERMSTATAKVSTATGHAIIIVPRPGFPKTRR